MTLACLSAFELWMGGYSKSEWMSPHSCLMFLPVYLKILTLKPDSTCSLWIVNIHRLDQEGNHQRNQIRKNPGRCLEQLLSFLSNSNQTYLRTFLKNQFPHLYVQICLVMLGFHPYFKLIFSFHSIDLHHFCFFLD